MVTALAATANRRFKPDSTVVLTDMATGNSMTASSLATRISQTVTLHRLLGVLTGLMLLYVYLPVISLVAFSFNAGGLSFPFTVLTLEWYEVLFTDASTIEAITLSLRLAAVVTVIGTIMATAVALAYVYGFPGSRLLLYLLITGIVVPGITYSVGANIFLTQLIELSQQLWLAVTVHVVWALPFATIFLIVGIPSTLKEQTEAARVMGAPTSTVFREVVLPQIWLAVVGAAIIIFTLSYNEGSRSLLLIGRDTTMSLHVLSQAGATLQPDLFALGSVTALVSTALLAVAGLLLHQGS